MCFIYWPETNSLATSKDIGQNRFSLNFIWVRNIEQIKIQLVRAVWHSNIKVYAKFAQIYSRLKDVASLKSKYQCTFVKNSYKMKLGAQTNGLIFTSLLQFGFAFKTNWGQWYQIRTSLTFQNLIKQLVCFILRKTILHNF